MRYVKNEPTNEIREGDYDGVKVSADAENARYIIEMPNSYDVYWKFNSKDEKFPFAERLHSEDPKKAIFSVPLDNLVGEKEIKNFNYRVNEARTVNREIKAEKQEIEATLAIDHAKDGKTVSFLYKTPQKAFSVGEILKTSKYFVAQAAGESEERVFIRIFNSSRFLEGKDFTNREKVLEENLPVGTPKYFRFAEHGQISIGQYKPKIKNEEAKVVDMQEKAVEKAKELENAVETKAVKQKRAKTIKTA